MSSRINVKVSTAKMISALEKKVKEIRVDAKKREDDEKVYEKKHREWSLRVAELLQGKDVDASVYNDGITLRYKEIKLPAEPKIHPKVFVYNQPTPEKKIEEIENTIRILKMTDEETVNTSTFKAISQYL